MGLVAYKLVVVKHNFFLEFLFLFLDGSLNIWFMHTLIAISWLCLYKVVLIFSILIWLLVVLSFLIVSFTLALVFRALILSIWVNIINFLGNHLALFVVVIKDAIIICTSVIMQIKFLLHNWNFKLLKLINQTF